MGMRYPELTLLPMERYSTLLSADKLRRVMARFAVLRVRLSGRAIWNVSSTAVGGGVAEMVRSLLSYARGVGVDARWAVIDGPPAFFRFTKRLHNAIHGSVGDGSPIGDDERTLYERVSAINMAELAQMVRPRDLVIVHDPQPAGMIPALLDLGAEVIWRCHIGHDDLNDEVDRGWRFLAPYLQGVRACVFSRAAFAPVAYLDAKRVAIIPPSIDPFSAKNQPLEDTSVRAILGHVGLITRTVECGCSFVREDGTPGRVDRVADVVRTGGPIPATAPVIVQVSRWDRLKDPGGVLEGFARSEAARAHGAYLVLAGPTTVGVGDDPEGATTLVDVIAQWSQLSSEVRERIHLASLPTADTDENAAMVNALQRHATMIVQKSLHEGFGLTVTEAMWKAKPVLATAVGGIQDQIEDGVQGLLVKDPKDLEAFDVALARLLDRPDEACRMGERGHTRVLERYLGLDSLLRFGSLIEAVEDASIHAPLDPLAAERAGTYSQ